MGSKLESYTIAADVYDNDDGEFSKTQRILKRDNKLKENMIGGNIAKGKLWN
jgi:hypothetical protein